MIKKQLIIYTIKTINFLFKYYICVQKNIKKNIEKLKKAEF